MPCKTVASVVLKRIFHLLIIYSLVRCAFVANNWAIISRESFSDIIKAFLLGIRFDVSALFVINAIFMVLWLFPFIWTKKGQVFNSVITALFFVVNSIFILVNIGDVELYKFNGKRLTLNYFRLADDINEQSLQLLMHYWYLLVFGIILIFYLIHSYPKMKSEYYSKRIFPYILYAAVLGAILPIGIRGGLQSKVLCPPHAFVFSSQILGSVTLNSSFTLLKQYQTIKPIYFDNFSQNNEIHDANNTHFATRVASSTAPKFPSANVVIFIMEGIGLEFMGRPNHRSGYTPFLDSLQDKALFFPNAFANGRRSLEALPSILASFPSLLPEPFVLSGYQNINMIGLPQVLAQKGYKTLFFHGAKNGTMYFDVFAKRVGVQKYYGKKEFFEMTKDFKVEKDSWGICDEPFFQFVRSTLNSSKTPFMATVFSLSSHEPYYIPTVLKEKLPKGNHPMQQSVAYADYSLQKFFEAAEKEPWFANTLFIITADHTSYSEDPNYLNDIGAYRVPLFFYYPNFQWPNINNQEPVQHADIFPTVVNLLNLKQDLPLTGRSVFEQEKHFMVNKMATEFIYLDKDNFIKMNLEPEIQVFKHKNYNDFISVPSTEADASLIQFKNYIQYFNNSVIDDTLFSKAYISANIN